MPAQSKKSLISKPDPSFMTTYLPIFNQAKQKENATWLKEAITDYLAARAIAENVGDWQGIFDCTTRIGICYSKLTQYDEALTLFRGLLKICWRKNKHAQTAGAYNNIANIYRLTDDHSLARKCLLKALHYFERANDRLNAAVCRVNIASLLFDRNHITRAIPYLKSAISTYQALDKGEFEIQARISLAQHHAMLLQIDHALEEVNRGIEWADTHDNLPLRSVVYFTRGLIHNQSQQLELSERDFLRAIELSEETGDRRLQAIASQNLAMVLMQMGDPERAEQLSLQAVELIRSLKSLRSYAAALRTTATIQQYCGKRQEARAALEEAIRIFSDLRLPVETTRTEIWLGLWFAEDGLQEEAVRYLSDSIQEMMSTRSKVDAEFLDYVSYWFVFFGKMEAAERLFTDANQQFNHKKLNELPLSHLLAWIALKLVQQKTGNSSVSQLKAHFSGGRGKSMSSYYQAAIRSLIASNAKPQMMQSVYFLHLRRKMIEAGIDEALLPIPESLK